MKYEVKKIGIFTTAEVFVIAGLIVGIVLAIFSILYINYLIAQLSQASLALSQNPLAGQQLGLDQTRLDSMISSLKEMRTKSIFVLPIASIILFFIAGIVFALIYNLVAKAKGLMLELKEKHEVQVSKEVEHKAEESRKLTEMSGKKGKRT